MNKVKEHTNDAKAKVQKESVEVVGVWSKCAVICTVTYFEWSCYKLAKKTSSRTEKNKKSKSWKYLVPQTEGTKQTVLPKKKNL